ncbi:hypothetical protein NAT51_00565 [Flavobacterium amniphilum]|uniref:hypothetical protein n=1 Tax=Flavobacterium amniphilum TaxID=1834035 RepID=UPI00202AA767|nr:hypothetical protein [Flavobacterium amniphilum]MCL9803995.1 hypothetical protein [Flavobacterium amniphilum]
MATYQQIVTKINGITDNGNNTAAEVRSVLTDMLNFSGEGFEISTPDLVDKEGYLYHFSFKGIKKQCCNLYFMINLKASSTGAPQSFTHIINEEEFELLRPFMPLYTFRSGTSDSAFLSYVVPGVQGRPINMLLTLGSYQGMKFLLFGLELEPGETVSTAVAVNFKPFTAPSAATGNTKKDTDAFLKSMKNNFNPENLK